MEEKDFSYQNEIKETEFSPPTDHYIEIGSDESVVSENSALFLYSQREECATGLCALLVFIICILAVISALYAAG